VRQSSLLNRVTRGSTFAHDKASFCLHRCFNRNVNCGSVYFSAGICEDMILCREGVFGGEGNVSSDIEIFHLL